MEHEATDEEVKKELEKMFEELWKDEEFWNRVGKSMYWHNEINESFLKLEIKECP